MIIEENEIDILDGFAKAAMAAIVQNYKEEDAVLNVVTGLKLSRQSDDSYSDLVASAAYEIAEKMLFMRRIVIECSAEEYKEKCSQ